MAERVLDMENLHVSFDTYAGEVKAVRGVTLHVTRAGCWRLSARAAAANP